MKKKKSKKENLMKKHLKRVENKLNILSNMRECGECQACCETVGVEELEKPSFTMCDHQCAEGCEIYKTRPASCQVFECIWKQGHMEEEHRPDKLGLVLYFDDGSRIENGVAIVNEYREGAIKEHKDMLVRLGGVTPTYIMDRKGDHVMLVPPEREKEIRMIILEKGLAGRVEVGDIMAGQDDGGSTPFDKEKINAR